MKKTLVSLLLVGSLASCADGYLMSEEGETSLRRVRDDAAVRSVTYAPLNISLDKIRNGISSTVGKITGQDEELFSHTSSADAEYYDGAYSKDKKFVQEAKVYAVDKAVGAEYTRTPVSEVIQPIVRDYTPIPAPAGAPANAKPGECFAKVQKPAVYKKVTEEVVAKPASVRYETIPAEYETVTEDVVVKAATTKYKVIPAEYETVTSEVVAKPAETKYKIIPAEYETVKEKVLVRPASTKYKVIPAEYATIKEQVVASPASTKKVEVPAQYDVVTKDVLVAPAKQEWKRSKSPDGSGVYINGKFTDEVMCLVESPAQYKKVSERVLVADGGYKEVAVPATYRTIEKRVVSKPEEKIAIEIPAEYKTVSRRVETKPEEKIAIEIPAEYKTVSRRVETKPEEKIAIEIPAEYKTVERKVKTKPASNRAIEVPAEYKTVERTQKVEAASLSWAKVLCEDNTTKENVKVIQRALKDAGYNPGAIDGIIGNGTLGAIKKYQKANNLAIGQVTEEAVTSLGLDFDSLVK